MTLNIFTLSDTPDTVLCSYEVHSYLLEQMPPELFGLQLMPDMHCPSWVAYLIDSRDYNSGEL
jgi:hypothetical protein